MNRHGAKIQQLQSRHTIMDNMANMENMNLATTLPQARRDDRMILQLLQELPEVYGRFILSKLDHTVLVWVSQSNYAICRHLANALLYSCCRVCGASENPGRIFAYYRELYSSNNVRVRLHYYKEMSSLSLQFLRQNFASRDVEAVRLYSNYVKSLVYFHAEGSLESQLLSQVCALLDPQKINIRGAWSSESVLTLNAAAIVAFCHYHYSLGPKLVMGPQLVDFEIHTTFIRDLDHVKFHKPDKLSRLTLHSKSAENDFAALVRFKYLKSFQLLGHCDTTINLDSLSGLHMLESLSFSAVGSEILVISRLHCLRELSISEGQNAIKIEGLPSLESLTLSEDAFKTIIIDRVPNLKTISVHLASNTWEPYLVVEMRETSCNLTSVHVSHKMLKNMPASVLHNLETLKLSYVQDVMWDYGSYPQLRHLELDYARSREAASSVTVANKSLLTLKISNSSIRHITLECPQLRSLEYEESAVVDFACPSPKLEQFLVLSVGQTRTSQGTGTAGHVDQIVRQLDTTWMKNVKLSNCALRSMAIFARALNLETLDLSRNAIQRIESISQFKHLKTLSLWDNKIAKLEGLPSSLTSLSVGFNEIERLENVNRLVNLEMLDIQNNSISSISTLKGMRSLKDLRMAKNHLRDIENVCDLPQLETLNVSSNNFKVFDLHKGLVNVPKLEFVLAGSAIEFVGQCEPLYACKILRKLYLKTTSSCESRLDLSRFSQGVFMEFGPEERFLAF